MKQCIVFDGNSILNRAFYGIRPLTTKDGQPTNAIYGFLNIIFKNISMLDSQPDYVAVAFDMKAPTFRHKRYDLYKANRKGMPEELAAQLPFARSIPEMIGFTVLQKEGYEADDILGTVASLCERNGVQCTIVTGDRDSLQLVSDTTRVFLAATNETKVYDKARIMTDFGVSPEQLIDVKSLMGDTSDNIPGVSGIGEKGALKLIAEYGSLDGVYGSIDGIKGSLKDKLISGKDSAYMSLELARIFKEVPLSADIDDYAVRERKDNELFETLTRLELFKMIEKLGLTSKKEETVCETVDFTDDEISTVDASKRYYVYPENGYVFMTDGKNGYRFSEEFIKENSLIKEIFSSRPLTVWNRKDFAHILDGLGISLCADGDDISLKAYVSSSSESGDMTAQKVIFRYLETDASTPEAVTSLLPLLYKTVSDGADEKLYEIELKLSDVLYDMEKTGFAVDRDALEAYSGVLDSQMKEREAAVYAAAGTDFNINSPKQLSDVLFERLSLPHGKKKNKNDSYPTDADVLEKLKKYHPIIDCVLSYRRLAKLKGTYADGLLKEISDSDGRIHTTFKQTLTQTGRLSSAEPNLQNIPVRQEAGREFRRFFIAGSDDKVLIDADYSQIELRVLAHISHDKALTDAFNNGDDIHAITASQVFSVPLDAVTPDMRKKAKAVNFGIVYGISAFSLAEDIGTARWMAEEYINRYFETYSGVYRYMQDIVQKAKKDKYVTTLFGRRRFIPELLSPKKTVQAFGERIARNTPIQGTAADIIKKAMVDVYYRLKEENMESKLILQVHDELIIESPVSEAEKAKLILKDCMENACVLDVPLVVDTGIGRSWYETHG
ncbi:MAG: DNA polymerase I [Clostridia bacterium]|nr:DNA polymerase I [Clostridia bacterium]